MSWICETFEMLPGIPPENEFEETSKYRRFVGRSPGISPDSWFPARLSIWRLVRFEISGGRAPENELYCRKTECKRTHLARDDGMEPLKKLERRLNLRSMRKSEI